MAFIIVWHDDSAVDTVCCSVEFDGTFADASVLMGDPDRSTLECPREVHLWTLEDKNLERGAVQFFDIEE